MIKRMIVMLFLCALVLGGAFGYKAFGTMMMQKGMAAAKDPVQTVSSIVATSQEWQSRIEAVGTLRAVQGIDIAPEVAGTVEALPFESGLDVEAGAILLQMDSKEQKAALAALESNLKLAELNLARNEKQLAAKAISQAAYDASKSEFDSLTAQVAQQKATLEKRTLRAPFAGRLGLRQVNLGEYVPAGKAIVSLQQLDPLYLDFMLPQQKLSHIAIGQKIIAQTDAYDDKTFEGEISAIESAVDEATRNVKVRATIGNPEKILRPGLFAKLHLSVGEPQKYLTLPQTAITFNPYGSTVYLVTKNAEGAQEAKMAFVKTGDKRGDQIAILEGVKEGDEVVTSGQIKIRNGSLLSVNNTIQPKNDAAPQPQDR